MELIREFMKSFVIFAVLSSFCIHLLPEKKYQKYARFVVGLVYISMLLNAAGEFLGKTMTGIQF